MVIGFKGNTRKSAPFFYVFLRPLPDSCFLLFLPRMNTSPLSVNDELQDLKKAALKYHKTLLKIEKVGNGSMSAFRIRYQNDGEETVHETFFWRHDMEKLISLFEREGCRAIKKPQGIPAGV